MLAQVLRTLTFSGKQLLPAILPFAAFVQSLPIDSRIPRRCVPFCSGAEDGGCARFPSVLLSKRTFVLLSFVGGYSFLYEAPRANRRGVGGGGL